MIRSPLVVRRVFGHSMVPVLPPKTLVIGWGWGLGNGLRTGHVVIFEHEGKEKIKRVTEILGDGSIYVTGDHPETSKDSRQFGAIDPKRIKARVIWPSIRPR